MGSSARRTPTLAHVLVRPASVNDVADVAAMERRCYADPWPAAAFMSLPENPSVYFAVARVEGLLKGYVVGWHVLNEAELANIAVEPGSRRGGLGSMLLDGMLGDADGRGAERIFLEVRESNEAARRLYASRGFKEIGRRKKYYRTPDEDALVLRREQSGKTE
jgi:ribosomal-protein-alanine N-acetyltransferase